MININYIGLNLKNQYHTQLLDMIRNEYFQYIDIPVCTKYGLSTGVEINSHVTLAYNNTLSKGPNWYYWMLTIRERNTFNKLKVVNKLKVPEVIINTFEQEQYRVLKIDIRNCNICEELRTLHECIEDTAGEKSRFTEYLPHITLTYLKKDTPDEVLVDLKSKVILNNYKEWNIDSLQISSVDNKNFVFPFQ